MSTRNQGRGTRDHPLIRRVLQIALARDGFDAELVGDGAQVLQAIAARTFDCIVVDGMMPHVDGLEVCRRVTGDPRTSHIPVIVLSARSQNTDCESALKAGATLYIRKPFDAQALAGTIREVIATRAARRGSLAPRSPTRARARRAVPPRLPAPPPAPRPSTRAQDALYDLTGDLAAEVASRRAEYAAAQRRLGYFESMIAVPAAFVFIAVLLGARWLSRALQRVAAAATGIASNEFRAHVPVSGPREIATLGSAINAACDALDERDEWLQATLTQAQRQRDFLSSIVEATSDGLLLYDSPPDRVILFNQRAIELIGLDERALATRPAAELQQEVADRTVDPQGYHERLRRHLYAEGVHQDVLEIREPVPRVLRRTSSPAMFHDHTAG